jgi:hypothetical protein
MKRRFCVGEIIGTNFQKQELLKIWAILYKEMDPRHLITNKGKNEIWFTWNNWLTSKLHDKKSMNIKNERLDLYSCTLKLMSQKQFAGNGWI